MQSRKLPHMSLVRATWIDSQHAQGWVPVNHMPDAAPIISVGFVIRNTRDMLTLAATVGTNGQALTPLSIPWGSSMKKVEVLT